MVSPREPPPPGALEDADLSDDEDDYDWYTMPRALDGRVDPPTAAALRTAAHALDAAFAAGRLDAQWGGVFGQVRDRSSCSSFLAPGPAGGVANTKHSGQPE